MSQRRTKRLSEDNSALLNQIYTQFATTLGIGSANARWVDCTYIGTTNLTPLAYIKQGNYITNVDGTDGTWVWVIPLPFTKGSLNLYLQDIKVGLKAAANNDEIDRVRILGYTDEDSSENLVDTAAGLNWNAAGEYSVDNDGGGFGGNIQVGGVYEQLYIKLTDIVTNVDALQVSYVQAKYYYA